MLYTDEGKEVSQDMKKSVQGAHPWFIGEISFLVRKPVIDAYIGSDSGGF